MFNVGGGEVLVILLLALIVLGPTRLPDAARKLGAFMGEIRRLSSGFQNELRHAMEVPAEPIVKPKSAGGPTDRSADTDADSETGPDTDADADTVEASSDTDMAEAASPGLMNADNADPDEAADDDS